MTYPAQNDSLKVFHSVQPGPSGTQEHPKSSRISNRDGTGDDLGGEDDKVDVEGSKEKQLVTREQPEDILDGRDEKVLKAAKKAGKKAAKKVVGRIEADLQRTLKLVQKHKREVRDDLSTSDYEISSGSSSSTDSSSSSDSRGAGQRGQRKDMKRQSLVRQPTRSRSHSEEVSRCRRSHNEEVSHRRRSPRLEVSRLH